MALLLRCLVLGIGVPVPVDAGAADGRRVVVLLHGGRFPAAKGNPVGEGRAVRVSKRT